MKHLTKALALMLCLAMIFSLAACQSANQPESTPAPTEAPAQEGGITGEFTDAQIGFGGDVFVTLLVQNGVVTSFSAEGRDETAGIGSAAIEQINEKLATFVSKRVDEIDVSTVDAVSGATVTSKAVLNG
ncbi:MAG: FMN-binding protein, partial [Christensenellales bacterium]